LPLVVDPFGFGPANAPIDADFKASGVDFADFAPLLPQGSTLSGTLDGHVAINGTAGNPQVNGALTVGAGTFRAPFEVVPIGDIAAQVTFAGNAARLVRFHAAAGGGTLDASGNARFSNLVHPSSDAAYQFDARAAHLELDVPAYGSGQVDGTLSLTHEPHDRPLLSGNLALSDATIPFSALLFADSGAGGFETSAAVAPPAPIDPSEDVALDLELGAQRNVRVRSANVDIGARGAIHVGGTRSAPSLLGGFTSAGGTLSYFNTVFRLIDGKVDFEPDLGVIPTLDARAVTHVLNPDPNTVRNITGGADVTLAVHGPVTNLSISLTSDPPYDREQILGLLLSAPALGASNLFGQTGQATLYGSTTPNVPPGTQVPRVTSGEITVAQEAFGVANAQFTRALLAPIESTVAEAVGLTNINVNVDYLGNVGLTARKILGKNINAIYGTTFGYPYRQTFGFELKPNDTTAAQVTVFETLGAYGLTSLTPEYLNSSSLKIQEAEPYGGTVRSASAEKSSSKALLARVGWWCRAMSAGRRVSSGAPEGRRPTRPPSMAASAGSPPARTARNRRAAVPRAARCGECSAHRTCWSCLDGEPRASPTTSCGATTRRARRKTSQARAREKELSARSWGFGVGGLF